MQTFLLWKNYLSSLRLTRLASTASLPHVISTGCDVVLAIRCLVASHVCGSAAACLGQLGRRRGIMPQKSQPYHFRYYLLANAHHGRDAGQHVCFNEGFLEPELEQLPRHTSSLRKLLLHLP